MLLLKLSELADMFQCDRQTIMRLSNQKQFPRPMRISRRLLRWRQVDIDQFIQRLASAEHSENNQTSV